jgi:hypothetical protein
MRITDTPSATAATMESAKSTRPPTLPVASIALRAALG